MIVVDTNIIAHFWLPSQETDLSDALFQQDSEWLAPLLWKSEFRSVVSLYLKKELIDLAKAIIILENAEKQMYDREFHVNSIQVISAAEKTGCSTYDCEFISLAKELNCKLITLDKQILSAFPDVAKHPSDFISS